MKSSTDTIISALRVLARDIQTDDGVVNACLEEAAGRLEQLDLANKNTLADLAVTIEQRDFVRAEINRLEKLTRADAFARDDALAEVQRLKAELIESIQERNKTAADLIKQRDAAIASARQEPSRLEIAAMFMAAPWCDTVHDALRYADELIAVENVTK